MPAISSSSNPKPGVSTMTIGLPTSARIAPTCGGVMPVGNTRSAPASANAFMRNTASTGSFSAHAASVRAMIRKLGSVRASSAALIRPTASSRGRRRCGTSACLPKEWSSMWIAATPACS